MLSRLQIVMAILGLYAGIAGYYQARAPSVASRTLASRAIEAPRAHCFQHAVLPVCLSTPLQVKGKFAKAEEVRGTPAPGKPDFHTRA